MSKVTSKEMAELNKLAIEVLKDKLKNGNPHEKLHVAQYILSNVAQENDNG